MKRRLKLNAAYMDIDKSVVMQTSFNIRQDIMGGGTSSPHHCKRLYYRW